MRPYLVFFIFNFIFLVSNALECKVNTRDRLGVAYNIIVSKLGDGKFTTIGEAIDSIPPNNDRWIGIFVRPGIYEEQITIPREKGCIILGGQSAQETIITNNQHDSTAQSITVDVNADNFIAKRITFTNSYKGSRAEPLIDIDEIPGYMPAVAFRSIGDKHAFYECSFIGYQDTLWDESGHHYFSSCYIEGAVDFIFGHGQSVYEPCKINATGGGYITAQKRDSTIDPSGYVFNNCQIYGNNKGVNLGRAYGPFSRVIFKNSRFDDVITPEGWNIWHQSNHERDVTYAEVNCSGTDTSKRVLEKRLSEAEIEQFTTQAFINQDSWIGRLPCFSC